MGPANLGIPTALSHARSKPTPKLSNLSSIFSPSSRTTYHLQPPTTVVNLDKLWSLIPVEQRDSYLAAKSSEKAPVLDLLSLGYAKVLGKGRLPNVPIVVRARYVSKEAERKIKEAGGVVQLVA